jgi:anti-sigma-K factor RskA
VTESSVTCTQVEELAAELALGGLAGPQRAAALSHLARCGPCRGLVDQLARAADGLLLLAPAVEPPPGFESRVLSQMTSAAPPATLRPRRRVWLGVAAVAAVAALSGTGVAELRHRGDSRPVAVAATADGVRTALVRDDAGRWTCRAVVYGEEPTWLVVSLDRSDGLTAAFSVEALPAPDATPVVVGNFTVTDGHGSLTTTLDRRARPIGTIRVLDQGGHVRYEMKIPESA